MTVYLEQFSNNGFSILASSVSSGATSLTVSSAASFPATPQFRIAIDQEIFLVTGISGNVFTVTPGFEGTTQAAHASNAPVAHVITAGAIKQLYNHNLGTVNYLEYNPAGMDSFADQTTQLQNWLLYCQLYRKNLKNYTGDDDQLQRDTIKAVLPAGIYNISCPLIIPEFVELEMNGGSLQRLGNVGGTVTNFYTGDTTSKALVNLYQPAVICVVNGHCSELNVMCNPDGVHAGSGFYAGKNWVTIGTPTIAAPGTGYRIGDSLFPDDPSLNPYFGPGLVVSAINGSGGVTGVTVSYQGSYALPPVLQQMQWTAANGYNVFDLANAGAYLTTGGNGTGASVNLTFAPDWQTGNTVYNGGRQSIGDTTLGKIRVNDVGTSTDATYGSTFGIWLANLNFHANELTSNGGDVGVMFQNGTDIHVDFINPVGANTSIKIIGGGSIECPNCVYDTAAAAYIDIDEITASLNFSAQCINPITSPTLTSGYGFRIGANSTAISVGVDLKINFIDCGTNAGVPCGYVSHIAGSKIDVKVTNKTVGGGNGTRLFSHLFDFGAGVDTSNEIRGSFDWGSQTPGNLFGSTSPPGCGIRIWNANVNGQGVGGYVNEYGNYEIKGAAAPTTGTWTIGDKIINSAPSHSGFLGWVCIAGGAPGTWTTYGPIT
jgi:hypothetical protein